MLCVTFAAAAIALSAPTDVKEVPIHHRRASRIAESIKPVIGTAKLKPHDRRSVIEVTGTEDQVDEAERVIRLVDIRPIIVSFELDLESRYDKLETRYEVQVENNQPWSMSLKTEGIKFTVTPRINEDCSITLTVAS